MGFLGFFLIIYSFLVGVYFLVNYAKNCIIMFVCFRHMFI